MTDNIFEIFLQAPPGLEPLLADEAREKGFDAPATVPGGVTTRGGWNEVWRANLELRGAGRVLGIDSDQRYLDQARLVAETLGVGDIEWRHHSVYDVGALGQRFDLVIFMGVLYHLRHPLLALDLIRDHVAGDRMLFQTMQQGSHDVLNVPDDQPFHRPGTTQPPTCFDNPAYPRMHFIEREFAHDWTNWWAPNAACSQAMLRAAGFRIEDQPEDEVYLCRIADRPYAEFGPAAVYPARGSNA